VTDPAAGTPYATDKIRWHPEALGRMRDNVHPPSPVQIHFMPMLACNQHCTFCAYGHRVEEDGEEERGWKNMELMSDASMPWPKALECIDDFESMGVKAIEITGGGEPLIWPHIDKLFDRLVGGKLDVALVTNGTALTMQRADLFCSTPWKWARVSIDAGDVEQYTKTRRVPEKHWDKAWEAVSLLTHFKTEEDQRVGVGYVVDRHNWGGIYLAAREAKYRGADNIRISFCFSPMGPDRLPEHHMDQARDLARAAKDNLEGDGFQVINLLEERLANTLSPQQDYSFCGTKEVLCVVGADLNVYNCCTLAFNEQGLFGSIKDQSFCKMWRSEATEHAFKCHDPRFICDMECLYERRNKNILEYLKIPAETPEGEPPMHGNFI
jgi:MoaA/NifB/PqqE/SkfB family radical SAM enzyme